jgi:hypothetical protein
MLPAQLPQTPEALRQLLALFVTQSRVGEDVRQLAALLTDAGKLGVVPEATLQYLEGRGGLLNAQSAPEFRRLLSSETALEARIARAIAEGRLDAVPQLLRDDLRGEILVLRQNGALLGHLRSERKLKEFEEFTQRILDRVGSSDLQRLRAFEQPYTFLELHLPPESGIQRAQVHFLGDGGGRDAGEGEEGRTVVLDLELSRLGPLWVTIRHAAGHCACHFQASSEAVCDAISLCKQELVASIAESGYASVQVTTALWNGDRIAAVAGLMDRFGGLRVSA